MIRKISVEDSPPRKNIDFYPWMEAVAIAVVASIFLTVGYVFLNGAVRFNKRTARYLGGSLLAGCAIRGQKNGKPGRLPKAAADPLGIPRPA